MGDSSEEENFGAVVIGSGFGGTIAALTLANYFVARAKIDGKPDPKDTSRKVCVLERGQWWISHELPFRTKPERDRENNTTDPKLADPNMREFLEDTDQPFGYWAHPDNSRGLVDLASKDRLLNNTGLYDYRPLADDVHAIVASGVGGGSLVYSNVTLAPPKEVYENWVNQEYDRTGKPGSKNIENYFEPARAFIGADKITTLAGLGPKNAKLERSRIFQEAADQLRKPPLEIVNNPSNSDPTNKTPDPDLGFALDLSITDVQGLSINGIALTPTGDDLMSSPPDSISEVLRDQNQQNVCQRQGRCVVGCLPGARHTLNKKLVKAMGQTSPTKDYLTVKALHEVEYIEVVEPGLYRIHYKSYDKNGTPASSEAGGSITTRVLVIAAGTLGTTELLLRSGKKLKKLHLGEKVGERFSTDGDLLGVMKFSDNGKAKQLDNTRGPINTCHAFFAPDGKFAYSMEDTGIPKMVAPLFATMLEIYMATRKMGFFSRLLHGFSLIQHFGLAGLAIIFTGFNIPNLQRAVSSILNNQGVISILETFVGKNPKTSMADTQQGKTIARALDWVTRNPENPLASPEERLSRFFIFSCMGMDGANGTLSLRDPGRGPKDDPGEPLQLSDYWNEQNVEVFDNIMDGMRKLAKAIDPEIDPEKDVFSPYWETDQRRSGNVFSLHPLGGVHSHRHEKKHEDTRKGNGRPVNRSLFVLHPLGGCAMGENPNEGVVNSFGQVFDPGTTGGLYDSLYVLDGSIVPGALGVNSSLTIAALAFRGIENLLENLEKKAKIKLGGFNPQSCWPDSALIQKLDAVRKRPTSLPTASPPPVQKLVPPIEA